MTAAMLPKRNLRTLLLGVAVAANAFANDEDAKRSDFDNVDEVPDIEFLEYLGMWEESDEDWQLLQESAVAENKERIGPVPQGKESTEKEDES